jgi:tetratricopeptide (TPR) repeat protein
MRIRPSIALLAFSVTLTSPLAAGTIAGDQHAASAAYFVGNRDPDPAIRRTQALIKAGDYAAAKKLIEPLAADGQFTPDVYYLAGLANLGTDNPKQAVRWFEKWGAWDGDKARILHAYALALHRSGSPGKAARVLKLLKSKQAQCAGTCREAADYDAAVASVGRVLGS